VYGYVELYEFKNIFVDLDGVIWLEGKTLEENIMALKKMLKHGVNLFLVTNNSTRSRGTYSYLLHSVGLEVDPENIITSSYSAAIYIKEMNGEGAPVLPIGEAGLVEELSSQGHIVLTMTEWMHAKYVVVGLDRNLSYEQVSAGIRAVRNNAKLIATNRDELLPTLNGPKLGAGGIVSLIETSSGVKAYATTGKPSKILGDILIQHVEDLEKSVFIGDKVSTDGEQAKIMGIPAIIIGNKGLEEKKKNYNANIFFVDNLLEVT
jgi:4-nitrophenyl phosphatase